VKPAASGDCPTFPAYLAYEYQALRTRSRCKIVYNPSAIKITNRCQTAEQGCIRTGGIAWRWAQRWVLPLVRSMC